MKNSIKIFGAALAAAVFIISSLYFEEASKFIGGWLASFIISGLFYWFGIKPLIRPQFKEAVIFEIATKFICYYGANLDTLKKEMDEDSIKAKLLEKLFPETFKFIKDYDSKFAQLFVDHKIDSNYATFVTNNNLRFKREATEKDKSEVAKAREKFIEELNKVFYKDLKD